VKECEIMEERVRSGGRIGNKEGNMMKW